VPTLPAPMTAIVFISLPPKNIPSLNRKVLLANFFLVRTSVPVRRLQAESVCLLLD
jgi:hypothetical protein